MEGTPWGVLTEAYQPAVALTGIGFLLVLLVGTTLLGYLTDKRRELRRRRRAHGPRGEGGEPMPADERKPRGTS